VRSFFAGKKKSVIDRRYLVIDMEMTGLDPEEDTIISAGSVLIQQGRIQLSFAEHHYFLPTSLMADDVSLSAHIHMITDERRESEGELLSNWLAELSTRLTADAWVFHHAAIDMAFLNAFSKRLHVPLPKVNIIDTLVDERARNPDKHLDSQAQLSLNACRARYGLPVYRQHHALSDALATAELWLAQNVNDF